MKTGLWVPCAIAISFALGMMLQSARGSNAQKETMRVTGVGGIFFKAQNTAKLAGWYRDHLGIALEAAGAGDAGPQYHVFAWREKEHVDTLGSTVFSIFPASSKYFDPGSAPFMINFRVANLARMLAQLKAEGVQVDEKTDDESNGRFGWIMDPEGHRIELWEPKGE
jgi:catechol 2,3-dioxygenase-like lactoylglutathione lyase family enzyme